MSTELVRDWMTSEVISVTPKTTLPQAHELMTSHHIRRLPVIRNNGQLVGIVTLGDIRGAEPSQATSLSIWEVNYLLAKLRVDEIMTLHPITTSANSTIGEAARLMLDHKVSGLPVVDEVGGVVGIITESDIFRMVVRHEWSREADYA
jgi:acetoin utilization protein AcuB